LFKIFFDNGATLRGSIKKNFTKYWSFW